MSHRDYSLPILAKERGPIGSGKMSLETLYSPVRLEKLPAI